MMPRRHNYVGHHLIGRQALINDAKVTNVVLTGGVLRNGLKASVDKRVGTCAGMRADMNE